MMNKPSLIQSSIDHLYELVIKGIPGIDSAPALAARYQKPGESQMQSARALVRGQLSKAGASGFLTGLGGLITLPVALPANLASVLYIQVRMIAAIAHLGGYNLRDEKVKTLVLVCVAGNIGRDILQDAGIKLSKNLTTHILEHVSEKVLLSINQKIGFRLLAAGGTKGLVKISKVVPLVGGIVGGGIDIAATKLAGKMALASFFNELPTQEQ
jgi:hypothetical protein